jgi:hypothetical protein
MYHPAPTATHRRAMRPLSRRSCLCGIIGVSSLALVGCETTAGWAARREFSPTKVSAWTTIMVFRSRQVQAADDAGISDLVIETLVQDLRAHGTRANVVPLRERPVLPRIELLFRNLSFQTSQVEGATPGWTLVVDCAAVSAKDKITFAGRVNAHGIGDEIAQVAQNVGHLIAESVLRDV